MTRAQIISRSINRIVPAMISTGLHKSLATFQAPPRGPGFPGTAPWTDVPGLVNIPCQFGPEADDGEMAMEFRQQPQTTDTGLHRLEFRGYYPTLEAGWRSGWRVVVDGVAYDVVGIESDSQRVLTRAKVRLVTI
jgi:hypothetical protein